MNSKDTYSDDDTLVLAAEECDRDDFDRIHKFSEYDERIIRKLMAHGPVLLQGGRGSGKSALMIEASLRLAPAKPDSEVFGLYVSLRYVPLLKAEGDKYVHLFCEWVSDRLREVLGPSHYDFPHCADFSSLKRALSELSFQSEKRVILLFDDAAHIGRETSLAGFFDLFRTLSSDTISCKASIYPGVTEFGTRFDVYNDATIVDVVRAPTQPGFRDQFTSIMEARYPELSADRFSGLDRGDVAAFIAISVLGNVRGFVFACNHLIDHNNRSIGLAAVSETLLYLAASYYWPLLDEVKPKLGKYTPAVDAARDIAEILFREAARSTKTSVLLHRHIVMQYAKPFEILEYAGFLAKREASRAMKSGGRGARYAVNLCSLLEQLSGSRLTSDLFDRWLTEKSDPAEIHERSDHFRNVKVPLPNADADLAILDEDIDILKRSDAYPYGLTDNKIKHLKDAGFLKIRDLAVALDSELLEAKSVGPHAVKTIRSTVAQAVWM